MSIFKSPKPPPAPIIQQVTPPPAVATPPVEAAMVPEIKTPPPARSPDAVQAIGPNSAARGQGTYKSLIGGSGSAQGLTRKARTAKPSLLGGS